MLEIEYGREEWNQNPDAAYTEAVRRIRLTRDAKDPEDRRTIWFSDLGALRAIPPGLGEVEGLEALEVGDGETPDGKFPAPSQEIESLAPLAEASDLRRLNLRDTGVTDLSPLARLPRLRVLDLGNNPQVADIAPVAVRTGLQTLNLSGTRVASIAPLVECTGLQSLDLNRTKVADIAPLAGCTGLRSLDLNFTQVADIAPLAGCTRLQSLDLNSTKVADIAPLAGCTGLQSLDLARTQVADIAPLLRIGRFPAGDGKYLDIEDTPAARSDQALEAISKKTPGVQAREVIDWLREKHPEAEAEADAPSALEERLAEASRVDVRLREGPDGAHMIALDRLGPEGAARFDPQAQAQRLDGLRASADDLIEDAGVAGASGQVPEEFTIALRRYRKRLDRDPVNIFELEPSIRRIDSALRSADRPEFDQMMRPGFIGGLEALVAHHDRLKPYFEPPSEVERRRDAALPPVRADADLEALRDTVADIAEKMRDLEATKIADGSLAGVADAATQEIDAEKARPGEAQSRGRRILRGLGGMAARLSGFARMVREGRKVWNVGKAFFESEEWRAIEEALSKAQEKFAELLADALDPLDAPDEDDDPEP
ncbi:Leucine Rich repeat-containing protein [Albimonas donghaensis]|uniref:Leucine Rich repeat-containing protein n=1 Tax=Albimonas donghaensis TaxID=356660 RepID=A0A1H2TSG1_9RHOB|nr:leucine-rich repeat domain-containing protein [Albimonas donghaensis]SDW46810.1 Leucine Rich repeat-containing protein [Albimonas donghaensis]